MLAMSSNRRLPPINELYTSNSLPTSAPPGTTLSTVSAADTGEASQSNQQNLEPSVNPRLPNTSALTPLDPSRPYQRSTQVPSRGEFEEQSQQHNHEYYTGNRGSTSDGQSLKRPRGVNRLPLDLAVNEPPAAAYLCVTQYDKSRANTTMNQQGAQFPSDSRLQQSQAQSSFLGSRSTFANAHTHSWAGPTLSDFNPSFSSLTTSGRPITGVIGNSAQPNPTVSSGTTFFNSNGGMASPLPPGSANSFVPTGSNPYWESGIGTSNNATRGSPIGYGSTINQTTGSRAPRSRIFREYSPADDVGNTLSAYNSRGPVPLSNATPAGGSSASGALAPGESLRGPASNLVGGISSVRGVAGADNRSLEGRPQAAPMNSDLAILSTFGPPSAATGNMHSTYRGTSSRGPVNGQAVMDSQPPLGAVGQLDYGPSIGSDALNRGSQHTVHRSVPHPAFNMSSRAGDAQNENPPPTPLALQPTLPADAATTLISRLPSSNPLEVSPVSSGRRGIGAPRSRRSRKDLGVDEIDIKRADNTRAIIRRGPDGKFPCPECDKKLVNSSTLQNHIKSVHMNAGSYACPFCPPSQKKFMWRSTLEIHIRHVHRKERPYKCQVPDCQQGFRWKSHLVEHVTVSHQRERNWRCPGCQKTFGRKNNWQKHVRNVHKERDVAAYIARMEAQQEAEAAMASQNIAMMQGGLPGPGQSTFPDMGRHFSNVGGQPQGTGLLPQRRSLQQTRQSGYDAYDEQLQQQHLDPQESRKRYRRS